MAIVHIAISLLKFLFFRRFFSFVQREKAAKRKFYNPNGSRIRTTSISIPRIFR